MKLPTLREVGTEAKLLLIGIPVFIWTMIPIYHMFVFAISPKEDAFTGKLWPDHPTGQPERQTLRAQGQGWADRAGLWL